MAVLIGVIRGLSLVVCGLILFTGCAEWPVGEPQEKTRALDGVKLIAEHLSYTSDERSFGQTSYRLTESARLLVRYENLRRVVGLREDLPITLRVFATSEDEASRARASLRACPVTQAWMMAATWKAGHPWNGGDWSPGGAFDESDCMESEDLSGPIANVNECTAPGAVCFDISRWYRNWVVQRGENFGLILVAAQPVSVVGDGSLGKGPRIIWQQSGVFTP
ncbi:MAG: hypothetical protein RBT63_06335 [Bdellovibrionales bacterium]|jgi:hypothetical protein|nr:hypothetical protein [Bdellovibrionales bacterium]